MQHTGYGDQSWPAVTSGEMHSAFRLNTWQTAPGPPSALGAFAFKALGHTPWTPCGL